MKSTNKQHNLKFLPQYSSLYKIPHSLSILVQFLYQTSSPLYSDHTPIPSPRILSNLSLLLDAIMIPPASLSQPNGLILHFHSAPSWSSSPTYCFSWMPLWPHLLVSHYLKASPSTLRSLTSATTEPHNGHHCQWEEGKEIERITVFYDFLRFHLFKIFLILDIFWALTTQKTVTLDATIHNLEVNKIPSSPQLLQMQ